VDAHNREEHPRSSGRVGRLIDELRQAVRRLKQHQRDRLAAWITDTIEAEDADEQAARPD